MSEPFRNSAARRIGLYHPYPHRMGGSQLVTLLLARELPAFGHVPVIICPDAGELTETARQQGIETLVCRPGPKWLVYGKGREGLSAWLSVAHVTQLLAYWRDLGSELVRNDIAVLHCHDIRAVLMASGAARRARVPCLWHFHSAPARGLRRWLDALLSLSVDRRVFVSRAMLAEWTLPRWILRAHRIIPNGLALGDPVPGTAHAQPLLLTVGALHPVKGQDVLLRALAQVRQRVPDVQLWIAGKDWGNGDYERRLRAIVEEQGLLESVRFLGQRSDVPALMASADVVVIPSRTESFGMVALEAMAQSKPVVASNAGGLKDIVAHDTTGLLVAVDDPAALAEAIIRVLREASLANRLGTAGRARVAEYFTSRRMAQQFAQLYEEMLAVAKN